MNPLSFVLLLMASLVFVLLGCSDNSEPITGPNDQALPMSLTATPLAKGGDVVGSVSGQGRYFVSISGVMRKLGCRTIGALRCEARGWFV